MIDIALVEDDNDIRESLAVLLNGTENFRCKQAYPTAEKALTDIFENPVDVILMDINLPGMSGIECVEKIKGRSPDTEIIMLTVSDDANDVFAALCAGASGYLRKNTPPATLISSIKETVDGGAPMSMDIARLVIDSFHQEKQKYHLTSREKEVLRNLCDGLSYKIIADNLFIDINTIKFHIRNIYRKLEVNSKGEAISKALREKLA